MKLDRRSLFQSLILAPLANLLPAKRKPVGFAGSWDPNGNYARGDLVSYDGGAWICIDQADETYRKALSEKGYLPF